MSLEWLGDFKYGWGYYPKASLYKKGLAEQAYQQIKELIQKPEVTEERIEKKVNKVFAKLLNINGSFNKPLQMRSTLKDFIRSLVGEIREVSG